MILKEAWEERNKLWVEATKLLDEGSKLWSEANGIYREAVTNFFEPGFDIQWNTGSVEGKTIPIPPSEVGL